METQSRRLDSGRLLAAYVAHLSSLKSARWVCREFTAVESWFRVELVPVLVEFGIAEAQISPSYDYEQPRGKSDLCVELEQGRVVFEIKHFVEGADRNKKSKFPSQVARLLDLVRAGLAKAGVVVTAFSYVDERIATKMVQAMLPESAGWSVAGPTALVPGYKCQLAVGICESA